MKNPLSVKLNRTDSKGCNEISVNIDLSQVDSPGRNYHAELTGAAFENGIVKLFFAQQARGGAVRSLVEVAMTPLYALQAIKNLDSLSPKSLEDVINTIGGEIPEKSDFNQEPKEVARLKASMLSVAISDSDACLDMYDISPKEISLLQINPKKSGTYISGVLRVDLSTQLLYVLYKDLKKMEPLLVATKKAVTQ